MRVLVVVLGALLGLVLAPASPGGGWATVGFAPLPDGTDAGSTWSPTIYVKQHGVKPLTGLQPVVEIEDEGGAATTVLATETAEAGVYTADVVFPSRGDWRVTVWSGFGDSQVTYGPFSVGAPGGGSSGDRELPAIGLGLVVLALLGGASLLGSRRLRGPRTVG